MLAAHPDDEVLGCGGALARHADEGAAIHVAFLADGVNSRDLVDHAALTMRREASRRALAELGVTSVSFGDLPDNRLDTVPLLDIVKLAEAQIAAHRPDTLYTHHAGDVNIDHRRLHEAVIAATRPQAGQPVRTLLFFEVASSTEWQPPGSAPVFAPNWFVDIGLQLERKLRAIDAYSVEMRPWPHPRSRQGVEHLARWRGATIGAEAAEAFILGRRVS
nr:PIG-L deacetylase family protein [Oleiharenicola lentus]